MRSLLQQMARGSMLLTLLLLAGCATTPVGRNARPELWTTYAANVPHAVHQRVQEFTAAETPGIVVRGFPDQHVIVSVHDAATGRIMLETKHYIDRVGTAFRVDRPFRPGRYIARVSQDGIEKLQHHFIVR